MNNTYILTEQALTVFHGGNTYTVHSDNPAYEIAIDAIRIGDFDEAIDQMKPAPLLQRFLASSADGLAMLVGTTVVYDGEPVADYITQRALAMARNGLPVEPLLNFIAKLYRNTSFRVRSELLPFLEKGQLPITPTGNFLAWKRINRNWTDGWTGMIDNSIGAIVEMPRATVDDNCNNSCSNGLHFASMSYVKGYSGERLIVIEINPVDVVSIPVDYSCDKGRCCRYKVVGELPLDKLEEVDNEWRSRGYVDDFELESEEEDEDEEDEEFQMDRYW